MNTPPTPEIGPATPLTAAYCAERAALAVHHAETAGGRDPAMTWLEAADRWINLGRAMSSNQGMCQRPPERDNPQQRL